MRAVVSLPCGTKSAKGVFEKNIHWLNNFKNIVVVFDNDEYGREAVESIKGIVPIEKLKICTLSHYKDPNEYLLHEKTLLLREALDNAKPYTPAGIINANTLWDDLRDEPEESKGYSLPWNITANTMIHGLRKGEMTLITAGTGIGKSTFIREIMYDLAMRHNLTCGVLMLEENILKTAKGIMGIHANQRLHISRQGLTDEDYKQIFDETLGTGRFFLYNHFGSLDNTALLDTIRYLAIVSKADFIVLDHVSIAVSGIADNNERKLIDILMTKLRSICEETGVGLLVISHLKRIHESQRSHEEGGIVSLSDLRGSQSLSQLPDTVIALERNQQDEDERQKNTIKVRVLKCRHTGETGLGGRLYFNKSINRLEKATEEDILKPIQEF